MNESCKTCIDKAREVIRIEGEAVLALKDRIDERFEQAVDILFRCTGRVIITGMGKSGIIAQKIASTLTSTGTASLFLHPAEGLHGDLGAVLKNDAVICISKSGNTEEILKLLPVFKRQGVPVITLTGHVDSLLGRRSEVVLDVGVREEACPYDLVPTSSTTAALVMGDALAMALFEKRGLGIEDFAQFHPGGDIGKRLLLRVDDVMRTGADIAMVREDAPLSRTILEITSKRLGGTCVMDPSGKLAGIVTDGDLRRLLETHKDIGGLTARDVMNPDPKTIPTGILAAKALHVIESYRINQLIVVDENGHPAGMVHLHDLLKAGLA
ncbi:MAG TPA: KpsF/GutQ family sugar-phosphate isomerase [Deltaproteobacteria bacterium]|nr:KpsF/GutQ family sugar-phosphate isomerase [Deltaproteobacteria bacterium]